MSEFIVISSAIVSLVSIILYTILIVRYNKKIQDTIDGTDIILEFCLEKTIERYIEEEKYEEADAASSYLNYLRSRYQ